MQQIEGGVTAADKFTAAGVRAGVKEEGLDVAVIYSQAPAQGTAVFTTNQVKAAPVKLSQQHLEPEKLQAIVVNSGNANACTGERGWRDAEKMAATAAEELAVEPEDILVASTGIIGEPLPIDRVTAGLRQAVSDLKPAGSSRAVRAIMTTDTFPKEIAVEFEIAGTTVRLGGIAKGSGMIEPNMATMLSFLTTDAAIDNQLLEEALREAVDYSFNKITVDGDQSTNDTVAVLTNGQAGNEPITEKGPKYEQFLGALEHITRELAQAIVRDGEGATKFVEIEVKGANSEQQAEKMAKKIADSNLVKTALFGEDPNWGRIVAAVGAAGVQVEVPKLEVKMNGEPIFGPEEEVHDYPDDLLRTKEVTIKVDLNRGSGAEKVWTCDLSYDYVEINAEYHT